MYRIPGTPWQHPSDSVPSGSQKDAASGAVRSPLALDARRDLWEGTLRVKRRLAPLQLGFSLVAPGAGPWGGGPASRAGGGARV
jgi:hypothetical protein